MPPIVHELGSAQVRPIPGDVLIETSLLCDAIRGQHGDPAEKTQLSWQFIQRAAARVGTRVWVTPAILQETVFAFMKSDMVDEAMARIGSGVGWVSFKKKHPRQFAETHAVCSEIGGEVRRFLRLNAIEECLPRIRWDARTTARYVSACMVWYLEQYPIEPADALHLACARVDGTRAIATNDLDLQRVTGFQFLAYRSAD